MCNGRAGCLCFFFGNFYLAVYNNIRFAFSETSASLPIMDKVVRTSGYRRGTVSPCVCANGQSDVYDTGNGACMYFVILLYTCLCNIPVKRVLLEKPVPRRLWQSGLLSFYRVNLIKRILFVNNKHLPGLNEITSWYFFCQLFR